VRVFFLQVRVDPSRLNFEVGLKWAGLFPSWSGLAPLKGRVVSGRCCCIRTGQGEELKGLWF